jgi:hypothetical protein
MKSMGGELQRIARVLFVATAFVVTASSTHALHLPELMGGMHVAQLDREAGLDGQETQVPRFASGDALVHEVWCAVVGLAPQPAQPVLIQQAASAVTLLSLAALTLVAWPFASRTRAPPLAAARLRATLQVFRN